ncbi:BTB/POZ protein [Rostrohypoxylon terebratum]|nr:BTB/POZ protein [Rostrohypoxylon terebratum]
MLTTTNSMVESSHDGLLDTAFSPFTANESSRVTLQVGERRFTAFRDTLISESAYFRARLSGRWNDADEDGAYFIDADPDIFEHILRYLRSNNFPVFFDASTLTFDHAKYISLLGGARYFGISKLEEWIEHEQYLDVVQIQTSAIQIPDVDAQGIECLARTTTANNRVDIKTAWDTEQVYVCPRGIFVHRGDRDKCGQACEKARAREGGGVEFEQDPVLRAVVIKTKISFNLAACMGDQSN